MKNEIFLGQQQLHHFHSKDETLGELSCFVKEMYLHQYFSRKNGSILNIQYARRFADEAGRVSAIKFAYFHAEFHKEFVLGDDGQSVEVNVLWALKDDMVFPWGRQPFRPNVKIDEITLCSGQRTRKILSVETFQTEKDIKIIKFVID